MAYTAEASIPAEFEAFRQHAYRITGLDLTSYKAPQMHRRLSALLARLRISSFTEYARVLERDAQRRDEFRDYVTINVSEFFRNVDRFGDLERRVLPGLLERGHGLRVWSAGCSIGAEAYSIAILLKTRLFFSAPERALGTSRPTCATPERTASVAGSSPRRTVDSMLVPLLARGFVSRSRICCAMRTHADHSISSRVGTW